MITLDLDKNDFGYAYPERIVLQIIIGHPFMGTYRQFDNYLDKIAQCKKAMEGCSHFTRGGKTYPLTDEGCNSLIAGVKTEIAVSSEDVKWRSEYVQLMGDIDPAQTLLPVCVVNSVKYAYTNPSEHSKYVGDYVHMVGHNRKELGRKVPNCIEVPFYHETFNAGSGRVTAGINGYYFIPKGVVNVTMVRA